MIVVVDAYSVVGLKLISKLNRENFRYLILVEETKHHDQLRSLSELQFWQILSPKELPCWLLVHADSVEGIFCCSHQRSLGKDPLFHHIWQFSFEHQVPLLFTTSDIQATEWIRKQPVQPYFWVGLQVSTVYSAPEEELLQPVWMYQFIKQLVVGERAPSPPIQPPDISLVLDRDVAEILYFFLRLRRYPDIYQLPYQKINLNLLEMLVNRIIKTGKNPTADTPLPADECTKLREVGCNYQFTPWSDEVFRITHQLMGQ